MTEPNEVKIEDEDDNLIPKESLPTDPKELAKELIVPELPLEVPVEVEPETPIAPESSPEVPVEKPEVPSQPAPVEGETTRERGLRLEIQRLRSVVRKDDIKKLVEPLPDIQTADYQILKDKGYSDEEIANMETAVDLIASKKGYIRADHSYATLVQDTVDLFTDDHPEYKPTNDTDDLRWNMFNSFLKDGTYNLSGKTTKQLKSIFERVNDDVKKELGEIIVKTNPAQIAAQRHKIEVVSHSGGTKITPSDKLKINPTEVGGIKLKGFTEEDFE